MKNLIAFEYKNSVKLNLLTFINFFICFLLLVKIYFQKEIFNFSYLQCLLKSYICKYHSYNFIQNYSFPLKARKH